MVKRHRKWQDGGNVEEVAARHTGAGGRMVEMPRKRKLETLEQTAE